MPIRFRCAYCNQLMAIARRKVGTIVNCPKCQGQVIVPQPDPASVADVMEVGNVNPLLGSPSPSALDATQVPASQVQIVQPATGSIASWPDHDATPVTRGIFLTPGLIALTCVLVVLLMGVAFFVGLLIGRG